MNSTDVAAARYRRTRREFWDMVWSRRAESFASRYYHDRLTAIFGGLVPPGASVIELGCGRGDLLAALRPSRGVGVDFSSEAVALATARHPDLSFVEADVHDLTMNEKFEVVVLSDLVNDLWDVQGVLERVFRLCSPSTRVVLNFFNKGWQLPIGLARRLRLAHPVMQQNWLSMTDVANLLSLAGFEVISTSREVLWPVRTPLVDSFFNRFLVKLWPFGLLGLTRVVVARPDPRKLPPDLVDPVVSVVVPARNEAGHIRDILDRVPRMGVRTELIFVEGHSSDDTLRVIAEEVDSRADPDVRYFQQPGVGKGDAVRHGFEAATGDVLMILDADMTVAPEELPRFLRAITEGSGELINGVRLVYPMEDEAMQYLNYLGNYLFGAAFSWLLRQPVKDTLCGTKVLTRDAYERIAAHRNYFGDFDPFGDFDLIFGAAKLSLKITDLPIRYRRREYGETNIDRWRHGWLLLRMTAFAARKL
ncbi:MAG: glycosyltransferase, partial [Actinobacteria bacterium]|nr:glycosyltransferase [Actinomycetota bacterium]